MPIIKHSLILALMTVIGACAPAPLQPGKIRLDAATTGAVVNVRLSSGFQTLAAHKTFRDIDYYHLRLVDENGQTVVEDDISASGSQFVDVPDGTYQLMAEAFDEYSNSLVDGGEQASSNYVTVTGSEAVYSDDSGSLNVSLKLLDGTSGDGTVRNSITIINGQPASTQPSLEAMQMM